MKYEVTVENTKTGKAKKVTVEAVDKWMGTEPCYAAETNAHISAFFARNCMRPIGSVAGLIHSL